MGEGNAADPYGIDPFSASRPCGQRSQNGCQPNQFEAQTHCYGANYPIHDISVSRLHIFFSNHAFPQK
ncbi:hypothetical protein FBY06_14230 [Pseudomonas sp. SJZ085]|nr:hypothetical protein FBX99_1427 [Pseudomonas sp. SJZ074]TWC13601.1 hypothetical protein FBY00_12029 [Pseudomonas sp. SJZ075]TWC29858.1 hypothetical protein FBY02_12029 [Pseudomonas sp. SJZ078]TWC30307.1 hypothetical protein FBY06_14230 [Pseudomonas sp. SJZ085]TWC50839.1 hypothetical protein FBY11_11929 [Pseudomonas sp. SJZ124]TWC86336.1 hypothetical protein FBY09_11986 [Pseudomonas sp. SJZ101]